MDVLADRTADLFDSVASSGFYPEVAATQLRRMVRGAPVRTFLVLPDFTLDEEDGLQMECIVVAVTDHAVVWWGGYEQQGEDGAPAIVHSHTRVLPLARVHDVRVNTSVTGVDEHGSPEHEGARVVITTGQLDRFDLTPVSCGDEDCLGTHGGVGDAIPDAMVLVLNSQAAGQDKVSELLDLASDLTLMVGRG